ncbi:MAG: cytochrome c maturation protein CcmE [Chloroflexi bacterium]|nr:cytochrome c maturation protein CcmE [Chloroflexota bacterium]
MFKQKKFLIGGIIILIALGYLGYTAFAGAATYYYTVNEVLGKGSSIYGDTMRVEGQVLVGSVQQESAGRMWKFTISDADGQQSLPVIYRGVVPDTFEEGNPVVVEGILGSDGIFQAKTLMPKCPSKYEPEV